MYARMPLSEPSASALIVAQISSYDAPLPSVMVRSTTETSQVGTRKAMPVSTPLSSGSTLPTAWRTEEDGGGRQHGEVATKRER